MKHATLKTTLNPEALLSFVGRLGTHVSRYGLVLVLLMLGGVKFFEYEAKGIKPLVENSPLMGWAYSVFHYRTFSSILGVIEVSIAVLIALRAVAPMLSSLGSLFASGMFFTTLTFLLSTPGVWEDGVGFPALSFLGSFLIKDVLLLGASLYTAAEAYAASSRSIQ